MFHSVEIVDIGFRKLVAYHGRENIETSIKGKFDMNSGKIFQDIDSENI